MDPQKAYQALSLIFKALHEGESVGLISEKEGVFNDAILLFDDDLAFLIKALSKAL